MPRFRAMNDHVFLHKSRTKDLMTLEAYPIFANIIANTAFFLYVKLAGVKIFVDFFQMRAPCQRRDQIGTLVKIFLEDLIQILPPIRRPGHLKKDVFYYNKLNINKM